MTFTLDEFDELRPFLYHVTARENPPRLQRTHRLDTADYLLRAAGSPELKFGS